MSIRVTPSDIDRVFPGLDLPSEVLVQNLNLDLGHLQLLKDAYGEWTEFQNDASFWVTLLRLVDEVNDGSLCLPLDRVPDWLRQAQLALDFQNISWSALTLNGLPVLHGDGARLYFKKHHQAEQSVADDLHRLLKHNQSPEFNQKDIKSTIKAVSKSVKFTLNEEQKLAMAVSLFKPFSIISGGPGTGKTTIMGSVLRCLVGLGVDASDVALAAPTGRAANRMTESLRHGLQNDVSVPLSQAELDLMAMEATTIHRLLGANPNRGKHRHHAGNLLPHRVIVVDEVSMVDVVLMSQLLAAISSDCRVILLGDQFQLPSVNSGAVLADMMPAVGQRLPVSSEFKATLVLDGLINEAVFSDFELIDGQKGGGLMMDCVTVLNQSNRFQASIAALSECVRQGDASGFLSHPDLHRIQSAQSKTAAVTWCPTVLSPLAWKAHFLAWLSHYYLFEGQYPRLMKELNGIQVNDLPLHHKTLSAVFNCIQSNRILTLVNSSHVGTEYINDQACHWMKQQLQVTGHDHHFHGAVIMLRRNDASLNLFNGDVGVLLAFDQGLLRAVFPSEQGFRSFSMHVIPEYTAAFAITVHKSQGSEFNHVLMPLPNDTNHRLLSREMIYTGMTRAKTSVQLVGSEATLVAGIERKNTRHTGLKLWSDD